MARLKRPSNVGPATPPKKKIKKHKGDSSDSDDELEQLPRRSARIAAKNGETGAAPAANPAKAKADWKKKKGSSIPMHQSTNGNRRPLGAVQRAEPNGNQPPSGIDKQMAVQAAAAAEVARREEEDREAERRMEEEREAERRREEERGAERRREEEREAERRREEEREAERRRQRDANQGVFDNLVADFFDRCSRIVDVPEVDTLQVARECLLVASELHRDIFDAMAVAGDVDISAADLVMGEVRILKEQLDASIDILIREEERRREEEERRREAVRRQEVLKREEARKKKEEEEEKKKEEKREKGRLEASMLDKECTICFDEITNGMACIHCKNTIGCENCTLSWLKNQSSCPTCRREYKDHKKEVVKVTDLEKASNASSIPLRRSIRGRASGSSSQ